MANVGLNIVEVDGRAAPSIQAAPTSVVGLSIRAQRGVPGKVVRITGWRQFEEHFGSYIPGAYGAYAVRGFFDNGGVTAYVTRMVYTGAGKATAAALYTNDGPWNLSSGDALSINSDIAGGPWTAAFIWAPPEVTGGPGSGAGGDYVLEDAGAGLDISITVGGVSEAYQFQVTDFANRALATAAEVAAVLNREFSGVRAWVDPEDGMLRLSTDRGDRGASLEVSGSGASELGIDTAAPVPGTGNVADINAVTPAEVVTVLGQALAPVGITATAIGNVVKIEHPDTGSNHHLQLIDTGDGVPAIFGFDEPADFNPVYGTEAGAGVALPASASLGLLDVTAAYRGEPDPGSWGNSLVVGAKVNPDDADLFDLTVLRDDQILETWPRLSLEPTHTRYVEKILNDQFAGSKYLLVTVNVPGSILEFPPEPIHLDGGADGAFPERADELNAIIESFADFDLSPIQLLACPEAHEAAVVQAGLTHCQNKGDRMFVGHTPPDMKVQDIKDGYSKQFQGDKVYGAIYFPWIQVADPLGTRTWIPPTGHILGTYARIERERGIWKAPAGNAARLNSALDVSEHISDIDHTSLVKSASVNAVRFIPGQGIIIDSSRTLSTSPLWLYVNVRLLFNFVKSSLMSGLRWVVQEPNDDALWNKVKFNTVTPFLMGLWRRGAFGPGSPEEVFTVKVDAENNPPENIQQGIFTAEIYFYPSRPAETIMIVVGQQEGGATASEG